MSTLFRRARLTNDPSLGLYDIQIRDGVIADIRQHVTLEERDEDNVLIYDLKGAYVAPSMVDHHTHFGVWSKFRKDVSMSGVKDLKAAITTINAALPQFDATKKPALVASGLFVGEWAAEDVARMTRATLDDMLDRSDVPVIVRMDDLHSSWANSAFLRLLKLGLHPTGLLVEQESFDVMTALDILLEHSMFEDLQDACNDAAAKGVTKIVDLDMQHNIANWCNRIQRGLDKLRVECGMYAQHVHDAIDAGWKTNDVVPGSKGLATVGPFKIITDGSLGTRTACCHTPYPSPPAHPGDHGIFVYEEQDLLAMLKKANNHGLRLAVHAIGDRAHSKTFDTFGRLASPIHPESTVEHAQLLLPEDIRRFKELGLIASIQPQHQNDDRELAERFWPSCTDRAFPYGDLVRAGIPVVLGSDAPVAPLDPWLAIYAGITRCRPGETHLGWHPEQKLDIITAYRGSTSYKRLQVQKKDIADLCILPRDPLTSSAEEIRTMKVQATMLAGRFTFNTLR